jgi:DNA gyrase/topoisomerase IV subunit B
MKVDVAMTYEANPNISSNILTFANMTPVDTQRSTPSKGFIDGVSQFFRNHMNRIYLATSKRKIEVTNGDVLTGLVGAVSSYHMSVMFDGQAKNVCKNLDLVDFVKQVTIHSLGDWSKNNPDDLQRLCEFFKEVAQARIRADKSITLNIGVGLE